MFISTSPRAETNLRELLPGQASVLVIGG